MNVKEMIENRIEENNVFIKRLKTKEDRLGECFILDSQKSAEINTKIKMKNNENKFLKDLLVKISIKTTIDGKCLL